MAETTLQPGEDTPKPSRKPILIGLLLALLLGGAGFYVTWSGLITGSGHGESEQAATLPDLAFVPVDPVTVTLPGNPVRNVRFTAQLEVVPQFRSEVAGLMPRILDVLNGYLRAVEPARYQETGALVEIRAQLLRRIQVVTGEGRVRDLLVTEFIVQ